MMRVIAMVTTLLFLSACGIKGPLYIPEKQYPQDTITGNQNAGPSGNTSKQPTKKTTTE